MIPERNGRRGNCYVLCESLYFLLGGKSSGWTPHSVRHEGDVHWFLARWINEGRPINKQGSLVMIQHLQVLDPTVWQFDAKPDYYAGRGRGFLTNGPSRRARELMDRMLWSDRDTSGPAVAAAPRVAARNKSKVAKSGAKHPGTRAARR